MEQVRKEFVTDEKAKKIALHVSGVSVAGNVLSLSLNCLQVLSVIPVL